MNSVSGKEECYSMSKTNKLNAVIVDDHPLARMAIKNLLESEGITVVAED